MFMRFADGEAGGRTRFALGALLLGIVMPMAAAAADVPADAIGIAIPSSRAPNANRVRPPASASADLMNIDFLR